MGAKYIYRMDDITPEMDWEQFWRYIDLFEKYKVKPLLGIVPDNQDVNLSVNPSNDEFWKIIKNLKEKEVVDIAQHGYQHKLFNASVCDCLKIKKGTGHLTEFAGLPYKEQYDRIKKGQSILMENGIYTDIWMAPCHSFDFITLRILKDLGFKYISDGLTISPFILNDLVFVPQQIWSPRWLPFGTYTICLHTNNADQKTYKKVEKHLRSGANIISFSDAANQSPQKINNTINTLFRLGYQVLRMLRELKENLY